MKLIYLCLFVLSTLTAFSQEEKPTFNWAIEADCVYVTPALRDIAIITDLFPNEDKEHVYSNKMRRHKFTNENALPQGNDPIWQDEQGVLNSRAPIENWEGISNVASPPDPSGAAGPNHYVQMVNSKIEIFDKQGNSLYGPNALSSIITSNNGDPIVMYDRFVDRWFVSGFGTNYALSIAISNTNDPTGSYTVWNYSPTGLPDYPKYGIWHDGYYITANTSGPDCYVLDRTAMLAGDPNAQMISMTIPSLSTGSGTQTGGFHSVLPAYADFQMPASTEKLNLFYFQDDAWNGINQDEIKVWEVTVDWANVANSTILQTQTIATTPFDSQFNVNWNDIEQPGTNSKLDGVPGAFMYRAQYTTWPNHKTVMLNHTVDVSANNHAGIRWYELRKINGIWSIEQESTYSPDSQSRWLGSISMDNQGNIGMAYSVAGSNTYASIMYTGRYATDPLNMMTIAEDTIILGGGIQTSTNRYGDYAHMCVDPDDDQTFWYTGEYISASGRTTRIASFKLASSYPDDVGITALVTPIDGSLTATETIEVTINNFGLNAQNNFDLSYQIDNGTIVTETFSAGPLTPGTPLNFVFNQTADLSILGPHDIKLYTSLSTDGNNPNDTLTTVVTHLYPFDVGVSIVNNPSSDNNLSMETISVTLENFGSSSAAGFDLAYTINNGTPIIETYAGTILPGTTASYDFTTQGNFLNFGSYEIIAYSLLTTDADNTNDSSSTSIENTNCMPLSNCSFGDGITNFQLGSINSPSGCTSGGYSDYTSISTDLLVGYTHDLTVASGFSPQYVSLWIDYNDNYFFEANEQVVSGFQCNNLGTTNFTIPSNSPLGSHLIRAKSSDQSADVTDPCSDMGYGETQDYSVNLTSDLSISKNENTNQLLVKSIGNNNFSITANEFGDSNGILKIHNSLGQLVFEQTVNASNYNEILIDLSSLPKGAYLVHLKNDSNSEVIKLVCY